jgi:hypothetical protein
MAYGLCGKRGKICASGKYVFFVYEYHVNSIKSCSRMSHKPLLEDRHPCQSTPSHERPLLARHMSTCPCHSHTCSCNSWELALIVRNTLFFPFRVLSFLHRPRAMSFFRKTFTNTYGLWRCTCEIFRFNFLTLRNIIFWHREHMHMGAELNFRFSMNNKLTLFSVISSHYCWLIYVVRLWQGSRSCDKGQDQSSDDCELEKALQVIGHCLGSVKAAKSFFKYWMSTAVNSKPLTSNMVEKLMD